MVALLLPTRPPPIAVHPVLAGPRRLITASLIRAMMFIPTTPVVVVMAVAALISRAVSTIIAATIPAAVVPPTLVFTE